MMPHGQWQSNGPEGGLMRGLKNADAKMKTSVNTNKTSKSLPLGEAVESLPTA
jgi:hypothetical protein